MHWQIGEEEIKSKDFSMHLPTIIQRIDAVSQILIAQHGDDSIDLMTSGLNGLGYILDDIGAALEKIKDALWPSKEDV